MQSIRSGAASGTVSYGFDAVGNLTKKSDFSANTANAYSYTGGTCGGGANAVKSVALAAGGTRTYCYDANGNLTGDNAGLSLKYDHQNLPTVAQRGALRDDFRYGTDGMRTRSWGSDGNRVYLPGYEHRTDTGETKVYIGDYAVISRTGATRKVEYLLKDRLGSVDAVANSSGAVTETRGYDAFGKPRNGTWNDLNPAKIASTAVTPKGFTQHEHLNELQLIHMNGRMYDYNVGRFMGVDPFIQFPLNSQSLNPYSYILNNPLSGTDPTGYASCTTDASAGECAAAAGSGGTAKVTSQAEGSRIKQTVGTVKNNGDGSATVTSTSNGNAVKVTGLGNGGARGQGTMGASSRQNQAASASEKGVATNVSSNTGQAGNELNSGASPSADQSIYMEYKDPHPVGDFAKTPEERQAFIGAMLRRGGFGNSDNYEYVDDPSRIRETSYMTTKYSGKVEVYPAAFDALDYFSFGSILFHEHVHVKRYAFYRALGFKPEKNTQSHFMMEAEAYKLMQTKANPFLKWANKAFMSSMRDNDYYGGRGALIPKNQKRVDANDFNCAREEC